MPRHERRPAPCGRRRQERAAGTPSGVLYRLVLSGTTGCLGNNVKTTKPSGVARFRPRSSCQGPGSTACLAISPRPAIPHVHKSQSSAPFDVLESTLCGDSVGGGLQGRHRGARDLGDRQQGLLGLGGAAEDCVGYAETSEPLTFDVSGEHDSDDGPLTVADTGQSGEHLPGVLQLAGVHVHRPVGRRDRQG